MTDHRVWKLDVRGYRLTNILLHILVSLAIFRLIIVLFDDWILALFTGALFVVHPIHTEAVAYISSRADSLAFLFMLLCFIFYIKPARAESPGIYVIMMLSYALAILSRENSLALPFPPLKCLHGRALAIRAINGVLSHTGKRIQRSLQEKGISHCLSSLDRGVIGVLFFFDDQAE